MSGSASNENSRIPAKDLGKKWITGKIGKDAGAELAMDLIQSYQLRGILRKWVKIRRLTPKQVAHSLQNNVFNCIGLHHAVAAFSDPYKRRLRRVIG